MSFACIVSSVMVYCSGLTWIWIGLTIARSRGMPSSSSSPQAISWRDLITAVRSMDHFTFVASEEAIRKVDCTAARIQRLEAQVFTAIQKARQFSSAWTPFLSSVSPGQSRDRDLGTDFEY
jgi:hypothetical protein